MRLPPGLDGAEMERFLASFLYLVAFLALFVDLVLDRLERALTPWRAHQLR